MTLRDVADLPGGGRLVAVDLGAVRVGIAVSDPTQTVASPAQTLAVPSGGDATLVAAIAEAVRSHGAVGVVVGYPRTLSGREGQAARRAREIATALEAAAEVPVALWDERFSTTEAERVMLAQDASRAQRRGAIDRVAAAVILQSVLAARRGGGTWR